MWILHTEPKSSIFIVPAFWLWGRVALTCGTASTLNVMLIFEAFVCGGVKVQRLQNSALDLTDPNPFFFF